MDGTLLNSEYLKALSYGRALDKLTSGRIDEEKGAEAFKAVVGRSRREVCDFMVERFDLHELGDSHGPVHGVDTACDVIAKVRGKFYDEMLEEPGLIWDNQWPYNISLLRDARRAGLKVGLATMSGHNTADKILDILGVRDMFDCVLTVDDIQKTKPDPEIYLTAAYRLGVKPIQCLVVEDSPSGVKSGIAAGMHVIAVSTPFTEDQLVSMPELDKRWLVTDPSKVVETVHDLIDHVGPRKVRPANWPEFRAHL